MKLELFLLGDQDKIADELFKHFSAWENLIEEAKPIFKLEGMRLELIARNLPHHQVRYSQLAIEAKSVVKWLENMKAKAESRYIRNYNNAPRALGSKEQSQYLQGEKDVIELNQLIIQAELYRMNFDEIVESIRQMGWMVGNMTKLRVAELQDAVI